MEKNCKICNKIFKPNHGLSGYCSELCKKEAKRLENLRYRTKYPEKIKEGNNKRYKIYYKKNKDKIKKYKKIWENNNPDYYKSYHQKNKDSRNERVRKWAQEYKTERNLKAKQKRINDVGHRLVCNNRARIYQVLKGIIKFKTTVKSIGCTKEQLKQHLESQFTKGMTWDNYGRKGWHVDHIKPCSRFDLSKPEEQKTCFHYTNLQPLWAMDNILKGAKYEI